MKQPFKFVGSHPSPDTIETLTNLLELAKKGELIGFCYSAIHSQRRVTVGWTGECERSPIFALGTVSKLHYWLNRYSESDGQDEGDDALKRQ
jgi:hypothetical protein